MAKLVCATTLYSCGLACVESILADNGIAKTQAEMIGSFGHLFPNWATYPGGITSPAECETVFKAAGLPVTFSSPSTSTEVVLRFAEANTVGAVLFVNKFYDDVATRNALSDLNHILRLTKVDLNGVELMNPYRCPCPAAFEKFTWQEVISFYGVVAVFKK